MLSCENPNVDKDAVMTRRQKFDRKTKVCIKCRENAGNIVIRYAVYCKACFFPLIQTRFRKSLEPVINEVPDPRRKALKASGSLLIGLSGGPGSTAMLDLVAKTYFTPRGKQEGRLADGNSKGGKEHPRNADKGIWKGKPGVCYVEVCGAFPGEKDRTEEIRAAVERYSGLNFEFIPLRLESCFDQAWWKSVGGDLATSALSLGLDMTSEDLRLAHSLPESSPLADLKIYLSSLPTQTAFYSAIQILIRLLLLNTAASRRASHLVLGTSLTSLSVNLISGIAQGGGFAVADEAKEEWKTWSERKMTVRIVRPLRDISMKECAMWDWWCGLPVVDEFRSSSGTGRSSIILLTRNFISGLESDYPATVSTVARTCAKLTPKEGSDGVCILCERRAQHGVQAWKSRISIRSYHEVSTAVSGGARPPHLTEEEIANLTTSPGATSSTAPSISLTPRLCYACHTLLTSRGSRGIASTSLGQSAESIPLPLWVRSSVNSPLQGDDHETEEGVTTVKMKKIDMEKELAAFLLPDD